MILFLMQIIMIVMATTAIVCTANYTFLKIYGSFKSQSRDKVQKSIYSRMTNYKDDIEFLEFRIAYELNSEFSYYKDVLGYRNLNTEAIQRCIGVVVKRTYESLAPSYKMLLLQYFSSTGLDNYLYDRVEKGVIKYVKDHNLFH